MDFLAYFAVKVKITHGDGGSYAPFFSALIHAAGMVTAEVEDPCCRRMENQRKMPKFQVENNDTRYILKLFHPSKSPIQILRT